MTTTKERKKTSDLQLIVRQAVSRFVPMMMTQTTSLLTLMTLLPEIMSFTPSMLTFPAAAH